MFRGAVNHPHVIRRTSRPPPPPIAEATTKPARWVGLRGEVMATFARLGAVDDGSRPAEGRRYGAA